MRALNFTAGPCTLPVEILEDVQSEFLDFHDSGASIVELSHRGTEIEGIVAEANASLRAAYDIPSDFDILFLQGGATLQFSMVPMNLLVPGRRASYVITGAWSEAAFNDARVYGDAQAAWTADDSALKRVPLASELRVSPTDRYLHIASNETIGGVAFGELPWVGVPLVVDASSDFLARPLPWDLVDVVYAGAQKNVGPAGVTIVIVRHSILPETRKDIGSYLSLEQQVSKGGMLNTPPVFSIYLMSKMLRWIQEHGGAVAMAVEAEAKSKLIYSVVDSSHGFYRCPVEINSRSKVNVIVNLESVQLEKEFLKAAEQEGMLGLAGHRSVGGVRASMYNAMTLNGVRNLRDFMIEFSKVRS
jgi:phosphoserine aminotransferase